MATVLWKYRRFIFANALADLRHRFSGSIGGYLWNVFVPLAQLVVFALIFGVLMGNRMPAGVGGGEDRHDLHLVVRSVCGTRRRLRAPLAVAPGGPAAGALHRLRLRAGA